MNLVGRHDPLAVANYFLTCALQEGRSLTIMQLVKLVYIAHGWSMAYFNRGLTNREPEAWMYGPVYPQVYNRFRGSGSAPISNIARDAQGNSISSDFTNEERALMDSVFNGYAKLHAFHLSDLTHQKGTPWERVFNENGSYSPIPNELISKHYNDLRAKRTAA